MYTKQIHKNTYIQILYKKYIQQYKQQLYTVYIYIICKNTRKYTTHIYTNLNNTMYTKKNNNNQT